MRFKNLSKEDIDYIKSVYYDKTISWDVSVFTLMNKFNVTERTIRYWYVRLGCKEKPTGYGEQESEQYKKAQERVFNINKKYYLVTWAQNNTPIHKGFFKNLLAYKEYLDADLHVIPGRYKNPTSVFTDRNYDVWSNELLPFLDATRNDVANNITLFGDIKIQPTAVNPMSSLQGLCYNTSCIFGSPKIQLQSIPVLPEKKPRIMLTTGACTVKNYTDTKSGKKGEFHHTYGAVILEVKDNETVFFRQITAKENGDFNDLYFNVSNGEVTRNTTIEGIIYGDLHCGQHDPEILRVTREKILNELTPKNIVLNDTFSGISINPHENKDPFLQYGKEVKDDDNLQKEINIMLDVLGDFKDINSQVVIVRSNHDEFLDRWLKDGDWKKQPTMKNSRLYMQLSDMLLAQYEKNPYKVQGVIPEIIKNKYPNYITLGINDSYMIRGFEVALHGHLGVNGSKGGPESFRKLNTKMVSAHTHATYRKDGLLVAGTSTYLRLNYNNGPSSWTQGHIIIDNYGKAQNIIFFNGEFTTFK